MSDNDKRAAADAALGWLPESGILGLGTGTTARFFIEGVGRLIQQGRKFSGVPTSEQSRALAVAAGIPLEPDDGAWDIAVYVDGADEVSEELDLIKGGGAAHTREKIVNEHSRLRVIVADESKLSTRLGEKWPIPLELLPFGYGATLRALARFGQVTPREKDGKPVLSDSGNRIVDLAAGTVERPAELDRALHEIPGVVETGLFIGRTDVLLVGSQSGVITRRREP